MASREDVMQALDQYDLAATETAEADAALAIADAAERAAEHTRQEAGDAVTAAQARRTRAADAVTAAVRSYLGLPDQAPVTPALARALRR